ncbi:MAG: MMPL family transporter [Verrucomicrobia bacterium]|nr:MMPL family transporter [Verrucomicrobiota bacterium]MBI3867964.1 MMPL family transporter [Verrucomicrobiota bacterium]
MTDAKPSIAARCLKRLSDSLVRHRVLWLYPQLALACAALVFTCYRLEFNTDRDSLVGADKQYHALFKQFRKEFPGQDDLVVVVESESIEKNRQFTERLGAYLEADTNLFIGVFYRRDLSLLGTNALLLAPTTNLVALREQLEIFAPVMKQFVSSTNLVSLFAQVNRQFLGSKRQESKENDQLIRALPAFQKIVSGAVDSLRREGAPPSPGVAALFDGGEDAEREMYISMAEGRIFLLVAKARLDSLSEAAIEKLRTLIAKTQIEVPGLNVGLTGEPVLEIDEMKQSQDDSLLATIVSLVAVALIFVYGYHETGRPLKATFCLLVGLAYSIGFTTLVVGHLNILTITFFPILIGLAIDFGVHLITRYEEELRRGKTEQEALEKAMVNTGVGIFTGALTTAGAFFAMAFTDFQGIREMGVICGGGMLCSLVPMMTLLPVLLLRGRQNVIDQEKGETLSLAEAIKGDKRAQLEKLWLQRPGLVAVLTVLLTVWAYVETRKVGFDFNLLNMQSEGLAAVIYQDKLITSSTRSVLYGAIVATNRSEALRLQTELEKLPSVSSVDSIVPMLTEDYLPKIPHIQKIRETLRSIEFRPPDPKPVDLRELNQVLFSLHGYLSIGMDITKTERSDISGLLGGLRKEIGALLVEMRRGDHDQVADRLASYQRALLQDIRTTFGLLKSQSTDPALQQEMLPAELRDRFIGVTGRYLLQVYPKKNIWDRDAQMEFVKDLRRVTPQATGTPVQLYEYTTLLKDSFVEAAYYSLAAISIMVLVHFRRFSCLPLALIPVFAGGFWMSGLMGIFHISFNPANIMTLPLLVGIGVTNGIHILNRYAEENSPSILARSTGKAVLVSGLTAIAGFGSLILAKHRGIASLGIIMSIGVATCMFVALTFLPALLNMLERLGWSLKKNPV